MRMFGSRSASGVSSDPTVASTASDATYEEGGSIDVSTDTRTESFSDAVRDRSTRRGGLDDRDIVTTDSPAMSGAPMVAPPSTDVDTHPIAHPVVHRRHAGAMLIPASFCGMLATFGLTVLLGGLLAAGVSGFGYQASDVSSQNLSDVFTNGFAVAMLTLAVALFVGGWAAGRIARFDGVAAGLLVVGWTLLVIAGFAGLGAVLADKYDIFAGGALSGLPSFDVKGLTTAGALTGLVALVVSCIAAALGGALGAMSLLRSRADERVLAQHGVVSDDGYMN